jgi:transposase InsO family protein
VFGSEAAIVQILAADACGSEINTSYIERDNLTSRHSNGRLERKTLSHSEKKEYLQHHLDLEDAIYNFVRPHGALKRKLHSPAAHGRRWMQRTPAMVAGLTDHIWSLEELLSYCLPLHPAK